MIAAHRERVTRGAHDAGVGYRYEGDQRSERQKHDAPLTEGNARRIRDRCQAVSQRCHWHEPDDRHRADHIDSNCTGQRQHHASGQVALGVLHLLRQAGYFGHADVADVDRAGCRKNRGPACVKEAGEVGRLDFRHATGKEDRQDHEQHEDQPHLQPAAFAGAE